MCGIVGIAGNSAIVKKNAIKRMAHILGHRGPDEEGICTFQNCVLGHRRLSIIDLNTGSQPIFSDDKQKAIVFNGEIYGYQQIRDQIKDYNFSTHTDTEVILALYEKFGKDMMSKLPGMFSFAVWDEEKQQLFAARDRFGEKPFFYALNSSGDLVFASEIKAIIGSDLIGEPEINIFQLGHYLKYLFINPLHTIYKNIYTLPPGHTLTYSRLHGIKIERYWSFPETNKSIKFDDASEQLKHLLECAVKKQLVSDVPIGFFLSGGLDSTTIVSIAAKQRNPISTFCFGFEGIDSDMPFAREAAKKYGTNHYEFSDINTNIDELILKMATIYDEPFADASNIPTYLLSKEAVKCAKVVLTGDGADELLGGYSYYYKPLNFVSKKYKSSFATGIARTLRKSASLINANTDSHWFYRAQGAVLSHKYLGKNVLNELHARNREYLSDEQINFLGISNSCEYNNIVVPGGNIVDNAMRQDISNYMAGDILVKIDRASMANSLELRSPFLDMDVANFCISLPTSFKVGKGKDKLLLRKAFESQWPESIRRRSKSGFSPSVQRWLNLPKVKVLQNIYLLDKHLSIYNHINYDNAWVLMDKDPWTRWILLILSIWFEERKLIASPYD